MVKTILSSDGLAGHFQLNQMLKITSIHTRTRTTALLMKGFTRATNGTIDILLIIKVNL